MAEAIANLTELGASEPVVKATLMLSESGFISVSSAVAFGEIKDDSIAGNLCLYALLGSCAHRMVRQAERLLWRGQHI